LEPGEDGAGRAGLEGGLWVVLRPMAKTALMAVYLHGQPIGRGESVASTLATRRACEEAVKRCKAEGLLDSVCTCPRKTKKGRQAEPTAA